MKLEFSRQMCEKWSTTKFHENLSSGSRGVPCGRADMTKLIVAFRNFADAPKNAVRRVSPATSPTPLYRGYAYLMINRRYVVSSSELVKCVIKFYRLNAAFPLQKISAKNNTWTEAHMQLLSQYQE